MITQTNLYNKVTGLLRKTEKEISQITGNVKVVKRVKETIEKKFETTGMIAEDIGPAVAADIYEKINILRDGIDLFECQILKSMGEQNFPSETFRGLRSKDRINMFLTGEFSTGKTTFIGRLIADLSGHISGAPSTAGLVIHKNSGTPNLVIQFEEKISGQDYNNFDGFLHKFGLREKFKCENNTLVPCEKFKRENNTFVPYETEEVIDKWGKDKIMDFLKQANGFSGAFKKIIWTHQKQVRNELLDFAYLFDMPGFGGSSGHDKVVKRIYETHKPDVVLYLIDTNRGIPSDEEVKELSKLLPIITRCEIPPLFCWVYQKPDNNIKETEQDDDFCDDSFLKDKRESLKTFLDDISKGEKYKGFFDEKQIDYLERSFILDARGEKADTEKAQNAISLVLQRYFCDRAEKYCGLAKKMLRFPVESDKSWQKLLFYVPAYHWLKASYGGSIARHYIKKGIRHLNETKKTVPMIPLRLS